MQDTMFLLRQPSPHRMVIQYHLTIGHLFVPNLNARIPSPTGGYFVRTNQQGFRSDWDFVPERGGSPRIAFLGDSFTAGDGVENHQRFTEQVGAALGAEVYNFAVSGTGTDQQLLIYEKFASQIEADLIVFCANVVNIDRNLLSHRESVDRTTGNHVLVPKPYFSLEDGSLVLHHNPVPLQRPLADTTEASGKRNALKRIYNHPQMAPVRALYRKSGLRGKIKQAANLQPYPDYADERSQGWQLMQALLQRFIAKAAPTPVMIVPVPSYAFYRDGVEPIYQPRFESLAGDGVEVIDITTPMRRLPRHEIEQLTFDHDIHHLSPFGHERFAEMLTHEIKGRKWDQQAEPIVVRQPEPIDGAYILGISAFYHNSAAALIKDGKIIAAAEEERFTRIKNDRGFPHRAVNYCLEEAGIHAEDLQAVVYYDNPYLTFERLIHTQLAIGERGESAWKRVLPTWLSYKLHIPQLIRSALHYDGQILQGNHHRSHAASAFFPSPFDEAVILTLDGVGEWATATIGYGTDNNVEILKEMHFPHSLGLLYSAFTQFTGFKVNSGEYKMMGLAPYGNPVYVDTICENLVDLKADGSIALNMDYFAFLSEPSMTNDKFAALFGGAARQPDERITQRERDLARSIQVVTEEVILRMAKHAKELTGATYLCMAGGVALNCVANGRLLREGIFDDIWIQPAAGDSGCALGAAFDVYHTYFGQARQPVEGGRAAQGGSYWGPSFSDDEVRAFLDTFGYPYQLLDPQQRADTIARFIEAGNVVGHFDGRLEYGPRALGSRSIIGDARSQEMQTTINLKIKYRESFRPFAPTVLAERVNEYFELDRESPYMLLVADVAAERRLPFERSDSEDLLEVVRRPRSDIPAVTHVDYSARIQTIKQADHRNYYNLIDAFRQRTGYGVIVNTSFNVRGEPIICTPYDAYRCFMRTEMDVLVLGNYVLFKAEQPAWDEPKGHDEHHKPDTANKDQETPFTRALGHIFREMFLPLAAEHTVDFDSNKGSMWQPVMNASTQEQFEILPALDSAQPSPQRMAVAIVQNWQKTDKTQAFAGLIAKLLEVANAHAQQGESKVEESVSDAVYVMY